MASREPSTRACQSLVRAAEAIGAALKDARLGGDVSVEQMLFRDAVRFEHQPSGFAAEYDGWRDLRGIVTDFARDLFQHLKRDETEAVELYQEPHPVRL